MTSLNILNVPAPGEFIREELEARGWTQRDLAFVLKCSEQTVNKILSGKSGISTDMAKAMGDAFEVSPELFVNIQTMYDLSRAREPDPGIARRASLQKFYPVREMIKRQWLEDSDTQMLELQITRFFGMNAINEVPYLRHAAKKTHYEDIPAAQLAWLFRVKQIASEMVVPNYSERKLNEAVEEFKKLLMAPEETRHVPKILADCGVRFVIVEGLPQGKIDGVCFWLDNSSPVIGMSLRWDRIDNFWFVLRHEIEHVLRKHGRKHECIDSEIDRVETASLPEEEKIANAAAADFCVPTTEIQDFIARVRPFFYEQKVLAFARKIQVHPGIVVGQLHRRLNRYDFLNRHQSKIRHIVTLSALTDGWGHSVTVNL